MLSTLFLLSFSGEVLLEHTLRDHVPRKELEVWWKQITSPPEHVFQPSTASPFQIQRAGHFFFIHVAYGSVIIVGGASKDVSPMLALQLLSLVAQSLQEGMGSHATPLTEQWVRENFSYSCLLLDELFHYGFPLVTDTLTLQRLVPPPTLENRLRTFVDPASKLAGFRGGGKSGSSYAETRNKGKQTYGLRGGDTNADVEMAPWRNPATHYRQNELLIDVVETVDFIFGSDGSMVYGAVNGKISLTCRLSGMPEVAMTVRHAHDVMENVAIHRCLRRFLHGNHHRKISSYPTSSSAEGLSAEEASLFNVDCRELRFTPPDGPCTLLQYRVKPSALPSLALPFYIAPQVSVERHTGVGRINVMVGPRKNDARETARAGREAEVKHFEVHVPLPERTKDVSIESCSTGKWNYDPYAKKLVWQVPHFILSTISLSGSFRLADADGDTAIQDKASKRGFEKLLTNAAEVSAPSAESNMVFGSGDPARVEFQILNRIVSNILVDSVLVANVGYQLYKGVKYVTRAGRVTFRTV